MGGDEEEDDTPEDQAPAQTLQQAQPGAQPQTFNPQGQPDALLRNIAAAESRFPPSLRTDRPYEPHDLIWQGPFFGKGGPQLIKNPITGAPMPMAPGTTPDVYLQAINNLAQAKARATANVIRGWNADQAASEAMARAAGVNPQQVQGLGGQDAKTTIGLAVGKRREDREAADVQSSLDLRQQAMQDRTEARAEKGKEKEESQAVLSSLPQTLDALQRMDPREAMRQAPTYLARLATVNGPLYQHYLQWIAGEAQRKDMEEERTQARADMESERKTRAEEARATKLGDRDEAEWEKKVREPLDEVASGQVKMVKVPQSEEDKLSGRIPPSRADYQGSVADYLAQLRGVLARIARKQPDSVDVSETSRANIFAEARSRGAKSLWLSPKGFAKDEALRDENPEQALESLRILAGVIQDRIGDGR